MRTPTHTLNPTLAGRHMLDISDVQSVQVEISNGVLWVNVDGVCVLRVQRVQKPIEILHGTKRRPHFTDVQA